MVGVGPVTGCDEVAKLAEQYGFDSIWCPDHLVDVEGAARADPWVVLAHIGAQTNRVQLSPSVTDALRSHPAKIAQAVATLDELTRGRAALGLGAGEAMNLVPYGMEFEKAPARIRRLREAMEVIRLLWKSGRSSPVNYAGAHYRLKDAWLDQRPVREPPPPIYIGALSSRSLLGLVGEAGDGWFPFVTTPEVYAKRMEVIRRAAAASHRNPDDIDTVAFITTSMSSDKKSISHALPLLKVFLLFERNTLKETGHEDAALPEYMSQYAFPGEGFVKRALEQASRIPEELVERCAALGGADVFMDTVKAFARAGAKHMVVLNLNPDQASAIKQLGPIVQRLKAEDV